MTELKVKFYEVEKDGLLMESGNHLCFVNVARCEFDPPLLQLLLYSYSTTGQCLGFLNLRSEFEPS